jgi:hypothetical protein
MVIRSAEPNLPGGSIINLETPILLSSFSLVRVREEPDGRFTAQLLGAPDIQSTAETREAAIEEVRKLLQYEVNMGSIVAVETPRRHPIAERAGWAKDDPGFEEFLELIHKFREEDDRLEGRVWETEECSDISSTPTI